MKRDPNPLLRVDSLSVAVVTTSGTKTIIKDISFDLAERSILGIIGETGAGKTVLSRALVAWLTPPLVATGGSVSYRGRNILSMADVERRALRGREIAYIGSNPTSTLDPTLPVGKQIVEKLRTIDPSLSTRQAVERVVSLLDAVRMPSARARFHEYPHQYSGGMMQRALIVDALVGSPKLLVADNVTQPLDVTVAAQILRLMRELRENFNTAIVFVSSSLPVVSELADNIIVINKGVMVEQQVTSKLVSRPATPYTRKLLELTPKIWTETVEEHAKVDSARISVDTAPRPILEVREASKTYKVRKRGAFLGHNDVKAVRGVTFDVMAGENFGIIGESGCGKSSLTRLLTRLELPDTGTISFEGRSIADVKGPSLLALRRSLQLVLQDPYTSMPPRMTIGRIIEESLLVHNIEPGALHRRQRVLTVMSEVGLPVDSYDQLPLGLSAGQRQRVNIARAMILEPRLLILDETLSALDQAEQFRLIDLFEKLQSQHGLTYIFISHDLAMVRRVCNRLAVMYLGEVVELASNKTIFFDPGHPYSKALLSAVPTLEKRRYRADECLLEGEPPSPIDIPPGCSFATRCPNAFQRCKGESPVLAVRKGEGLSACFLSYVEVKGNIEDQQDIRIYPKTR